MSRFMTFEGRYRVVEAVDSPSRAAYWLAAYALGAHASGFPHTAAHALSEAAYSFHRTRPALTTALLGIAQRLFTETGAPECRDVIAAVEIALGHHRELDVAGPGLSSRLAGLLRGLSRLTGVQLDLALWVDMTATTEGYPVDCGLLPPNAAPSLKPGAHQMPARKILRALRRNDHGRAERAAEQFVDAAEKCGDRDLAYRELRDLTRVLLAQRHYRMALNMAGRLFALTSDTTMADEVAALCRIVASGSRDRYTKLTATAYQAHALARGHSYPQYAYGARLLMETLKADDIDDYPDVRRLLLWNSFYVLHKLGDYYTALACLDAITPFSDDSSKVRLRWARIDLYSHLGLYAGDEQLDQLRKDAQELEDVRWLAEIDHLIGRQRIQHGDPVVGERHIMIAAEGFRRVGAMDHMANCFSSLAQWWITQEQWNAALMAIRVALRVCDDAGDVVQSMSLRFDGARVLYKLGDIGIEDLAAKFAVAHRWVTFDHQIMTALQFLNVLGDDYPEVRFEHATAALEAFTTWWSRQEMTSWRAGLLHHELSIRSHVLDAAVQLAHDPVDVVRLIVEGANLALPAGVSPAPVVLTDHPTLDAPEVVDEIAGTLSARGVSLRFADDPQVHRIPLAEPTRVTLGHGDPRDGALHLPTVARTASASADWVWWSQWSSGPTLHHGIVTSSGDCWYEQTSLSTANSALHAYRDVLPMMEGNDGDVRARIRAAIRVRPEEEERLAAALGTALIPPRLAEYLVGSSAVRTTLLVQPSRITGAVPFALLPLPGRHSRIADHASVNHCPGLGLFTPSPEHPEPTRGSALVLDPGGQPLLGRHATALPDPDDLTHVFARRTLPDWALRRLDPVPPLPADRETLRATLAARPVRRIVYAGHVTSTDVLTPGASAFILADGPLTAAEWLRDPRLLPAPQELLLIGCDSSASRALEPLGLTTAALSAGVERVIGSSRPLPNTAGMWNAASELVRLTTQQPFAAAVSSLTTTRLRAWRETGDQTFHPLHWSAFIAMERKPP